MGGWASRIYAHYCFVSLWGPLLLRGFCANNYQLLFDSRDKNGLTTSSIWLFHFVSNDGYTARSISP
ncbi:hypothetical protein THAOC_31775 [Thalassiosira oceanica]|uniref:Uncharacterized protein n=1 Tax=Thalassiosira oceanica TaxID=159749 RepID=K0R8J4_THAOC|nr:hypothetical protein THAOC_31775 [Thalassiosira oceanica]|eukprot:EJK49355.1 hypothetical protein THAOC_31775 [Thalassiosira oceanica]